MTNARRTTISLKRSGLLRPNQSSIRRPSFILHIAASVFVRRPTPYRLPILTNSPSPQSPGTSAPLGGKRRSQEQAEYPSTT